MDETSDAKPDTGIAEAAQDRPPRRKTTPVEKAIIAVIVVGCMIGVVIKGARGDHDSKHRDATIACEDYVKARLKSPASAKFSHVKTTGPDTPETANYVVAGQVDSENSFGAQIRNQFECDLHDGGDDNWYLNSLTGLAN